jgi:hypothetical protein
MRRYYTDIKFVFAMAKVTRYSSADLTRATMDAIHNAAYKKEYGKGDRKRPRLNQFETGALRGYADALRDIFEADNTEHCYLYDGELYSTSKISTRKRTRDVDSQSVFNNCPSAIFYKDADIVYFATEEDKTALRDGGVK